MAISAAGAGAGAGVATAGPGNPFQLATNLYCEKNTAGTTASTAIGTSQTNGGGAVNSGNYLRAVRLIVRTATAGTTGTAATTSDLPWNIFASADLLNVDGSPILTAMGGYAHMLAQKYSRPWLGDPNVYPDAVNSTASSPQFTLTLQPEIRWTAGVLANTDTRSQYRFDYAIDTAANIIQGGTTWTGGPFLTVQPYMDAWAQPDDRDLQGTQNQPVPPGLNLQNKRRHNIYTLNASTSDNVMQSNMTGNAIRCHIFVTRTTSNLTRADMFSDPLTLSLDNRTLGKFSVQLGTTQATGGDMVSIRMQEFYNKYFTTKITSTATGGVATAYVPYIREQGVYVFPRFLQPGDLFGEGWMYTANSTKLIFETNSNSNYSTSATAELITDEVYAVGPLSSDLIDI